MQRLLNEIILNYIQVKEPLLKPSTIARYSNLYLNHIQKYFFNIYAIELSNRMLQDYVDILIKKKVSPIVIKESILLIKLSLKRETKFNEFTMPFIDLDIPSLEKKKKIETLTRIEEKQVINYISNGKKNKYCGVVLALLTGMRIGEICALKRNDIDLKKRQINVNKTLQRICIKNKKSEIQIGKTKTSSGSRIIPISNFLYDFLLSIRPSNRETYFLTNSFKPKEPRNYRKIYKTLLKKLKIKTTTFHALRHTFATRLIENKIDIKTISELLGHSSTNITISIYVHSEYSTKRKAIKSLDNLILK